MIAIDQGNQQALDADPRAIGQNSFNGNLDCAGSTTMFLFLKKINKFGLLEMKKIHSLVS